MTRTCFDCPREISKVSKGRCRSCAMKALNSDPAFVAKKIAATAVACRTPEYRQRMSEMGKRLEAERAQDPAYVEWKRENGRRHGGRGNLTDEHRRKAGETVRRQAIPWCPPEHYGWNRQLKRQGFLLAERKSVILSQVEADARAERRRFAALPYEEQIAERLANGATVTVRRAMPAREHAFSLTGSGLSQ